MVGLRYFEKVQTFLCLGIETAVNQQSCLYNLKAVVIIPIAGLLGKVCSLVDIRLCLLVNVWTVSVDELLINAQFAFSVGNVLDTKFYLLKLPLLYGIIVCPMGNG